VSKLSDLPVEPAKGQQWKVKGVRQVGEVERAGYKPIKQHTYAEFEEIKCTLPHDHESLITFIANSDDFRGIGESKARALVERFKVDTHYILKKRRECDYEPLREILSDKSIDALYEGYEKYKNLAASNYLTNLNVPSDIQYKLFAFHNEHSLDAVKQNPYLLMTFGMKFDDVDAIAKQHFDAKNDDLNRLEAVVELAMQKEEISKGHTFTTHSALRKRVSGILSESVKSELVSQAMKLASDTAKFIINSETGTYHPLSLIFQETVVAKRLVKLSKRHIDSENDYLDSYQSAINEPPYPLTAKQRDAVKTSLLNNVSCITGGAGTGKTTVLRTVLRAYKNRGFKVHAVALSGRAAMRLHESTGFETMTIARFLRNDFIEPTLLERDNVLVIDEASMVDLNTMYRIVNHIHPSVRIIFTGDENQLPPIGAGRVLADVVLSQVIKNTKLNIVKRQDGSTGIPEYSMSINDGKVPPKLSTGAITFHECERHQITNLCTKLYLDNSTDSRVIAPTRKLVSDINNQCQRYANPNGQLLEFRINGDNFYLNYRVGDPILFTKNDYNRGFQNGSLGVLTSANDDLIGLGSVMLDVGDNIEVCESVLDCMALGYAITLHKAQGSQFLRIIVALQPGRIVDRAWLYTAITRAEAEVHIVGSAEDFRHIIEADSHTNQRNSYLSELLQTVEANAYEQVEVGKQEVR
jgi:exodeoxyribonuclease V alpha subunit